MTNPTQPIGYPPQPGYQQPPQPPQPKKTPLAVKIVVIVAILIWVGGCGAIIAAIGSSDPAAVPAPTTAPPAPSTAAPSASPAAQRYETVIELRDAVVQAGYPCTAWFEHDADIKEKYAKESGQCSDADGLSIYADESDVQKNVDWSTGATLVVGPNWILFLPEGHIKRVHAALSGKLVDRPADPEPESVEPEMPGIGDKVRDDDYQFTVTKVRCGVSRIGDSYLNEKAQGQFCLVTMKVKNVGDDAINFSTDNQAPFDTKGKEYSPDDGAWLYLEDAEILDEINPGNSIKTTVPFDIPKKAKPDHLLLKAGVWGASDGVMVKL